MKIKNWSKFQHFKDRRPPWVKLYRDLLDDMEWHELDPLSSKVLITLWLLASEDDTQQGNLPCMKTLAWRLRMPEKQVSECINKLSHWLEQDDINVISSRYQHDAPETETETETNRGAVNQQVESLFNKFWQFYPKKVGKDAAQKAFSKRKPDEPLLLLMLKAIDNQKNTIGWQKDDGQYIPNPATWLNQGRWQDQLEAPKQNLFAGGI